MAMLLPTIGVWLLVHGFWRSHASATSPSGRLTAESANWYVWAPIYGWNHFYLSVHPATRIRCKLLRAPWRDTPPDITSWKYEHLYAVYNNFDAHERFPSRIRWLSETEFVVEGGEGDGSIFEVEH